MVYWSSKTIFKKDFCDAAKPVVLGNLDKTFGVISNKDFQACMIKKMRV